MQNSQGPANRDPQLWEIAERRASFKSHIVIYILVNALLWALWIFQGKDYQFGDIPWPVWSTVGWGIGVIMHYVGAYVNPKNNAVEREYEKLKNKQDKNSSSI